MVMCQVVILTVRGFKIILIGLLCCTLTSASELESTAEHSELQTELQPGCYSLQHHRGPPAFLQSIIYSLPFLAPWASVSCFPASLKSISVLSINAMINQCILLRDLSLKSVKWQLEHPNALTCQTKWNIWNIIKTTFDEIVRDLIYNYNYIS